MNETQIERLRNVTHTLDELTTERAELLFSLSALVVKANQLYYKAQSEVDGQFPHTLWSSYDGHPIFQSNITSFDVELNDSNEFFTALIEYHEYFHGEMDDFSWKLLIPFDEAKLPQYVQSQKDKWLAEAQAAKLKKDEKELTEKKQQLESLKKELGVS